MQFLTEVIGFCFSWGNRRPDQKAVRQTAKRVWYQRDVDWHISRCHGRLRYCHHGSSIMLPTRDVRAFAAIESKAHKPADLARVDEVIESASFAASAHGRF